MNKAGVSAAIFMTIIIWAVIVLLLDRSGILQ